MKDAVLSLARHGLTSVGGYLAGKGIIGESEWAVLVPAILVIVSVAWSKFDRTKAAP
jgi:hypothetical protein